MTRETKIGLLVGLVFIFAFGLILGYRNQEVIPQTAQATPTIQVYPERIATVTSYRELAARGATPVLPESPSLPQSALPVIAPPRETVTLMPPSWAERPGVQPPAETVRQSLPVAEQTAVAPLPMLPPAAPSRKYTVAQGDTLSKIARKEYSAAIQAGASEHTLASKIFEANRDKLANRDSLKLGQELVIPALENAPTARQSAPAVQDVNERELREYLQRQPEGPRPSTPAAGVAGRQYTTQRGDSLSSIARKEMSDGSRKAIQKLYEANKDKLRSINDVPVGVVLVVPG